MKRGLDIVGAGLGIILTSPLWIAAAIAIKLEGSGPVLYRARRVGRAGVEFDLYKFRTMRQAPGSAVTTSGDPRITRVGRLLRTSKIDELPQLWNVLIGQMSLVGPRPEDPRYVANYAPDQRWVLSVRPGITGLAAVAYRDEESLLAAYEDPEAAYVSEILPRKLALDLQYVEHHPIGRDIKILGRTILALLRHHNSAPTEPGISASSD